MFPCRVVRLLFGIPQGYNIIPLKLQAINPHPSTTRRCTTRTTRHDTSHTMRVFAYTPIKAKKEKKNKKDGRECRARGPDLE